MNSTVTLLGYLGGTPELRDTASRTLEIERYNEVAESSEIREVQTRSREYAVFSVATHAGLGPHRTTTWNRCIVWNADRMEFRNLRLAKKGERVEVTGRWELHSFDDAGTGERVTLRQLAVQRVRVLGRKPAPEGDPDEPFALPRRRATA